MIATRSVVTPKNSNASLRIAGIISASPCVPVRRYLGTRIARCGGAILPVRGNPAHSLRWGPAVTGGRIKKPSNFAPRRPQNWVLLSASSACQKPCSNGLRNAAAPSSARRPPVLGPRPGAYFPRRPACAPARKIFGTAQVPAVKKIGQVSFLNSHIIILRSETRSLRRRLGRCRNQAPRQRCA